MFVVGSIYWSVFTVMKFKAYTRHGLLKSKDLTLGQAEDTLIELMRIDPNACLFIHEHGKQRKVQLHPKQQTLPVQISSTCSSKLVRDKYGIIQVRASIGLS